MFKKKSSQEQNSKFSRKELNKLPKEALINMIFEYEKANNHLFKTGAEGMVESMKSSTKHSEKLVETFSDTLEVISNVLTKVKEHVEKGDTEKALELLNKYENIKIKM